MEETAVIKGLSRQAKAIGLPLMPYAMGVGFLSFFPFLIIKNPLLLLSFFIFWPIAKSIVMINPQMHRPFVVRIKYLFGTFRSGPVTFKRSGKGTV